MARLAGSCIASALLLAPAAARPQDVGAALGPLRFEASQSSADGASSTRAAHSYSATARIEARRFAVALDLFGGQGDPLAQDPARHEDFLAPEFAWFLSPACTVRAQVARALRAGSDDQVSLTVSWQF